MASKITYTPKEVIEGKLLAALDDEDKVAAVFSKQDLDDLISAFYAAITLGEAAGPKKGRSGEQLQRFREMLDDFKKLRTAAFGGS